MLQDLGHSYDYGGHKFQRSTGWVSKLKTQQSLVPAWIWSSENQESWWCSSSPKLNKFKIQEEPGSQFKDRKTEKILLL